jgi:hypothetical protein
METHAKGNKALWSNDTLLNKDSTNVRPERKSSLLNADGDSGHDSGDISESEDDEKEVEDNIARKRISDLEVCLFPVF